MKKVVPILSYVVYIALSIWAIFTLKADINSLPPQTGDVGTDISASISEAVLNIFIAFLKIYVAVVIAALLFKLLQIATGFGLFGFINLIFDLAFLALHGFVLYYVIVGEGYTSAIVIFGGLFALSFASLISHFSSSKG